MRHLSTSTHLGRVLAAALMASALAPGVAAAYTGPNEPHIARPGQEPPRLVQPDSAPVRTGPTPDVVLSRSGSPLAESSGVTSGPTPDVILSRTDSPPVPPETVAAAEPGGFDWGSAGIGAAVAAGLAILSIAALGGTRRRRAFTG